MDKVALFDGDSLVYRAGFAVEKTKYLVTNGTMVWFFDSAKEARESAEAFPDRTLWTRKEIGKLEDAKRIIDNVLDTAIAISSATDYRVYLSPASGNFREKIATLVPYKGNRGLRERPFYYSDLRDYLMGRYKAQIAKGEEADDKLSYVARNLRDFGTGYIICGHDKDLLQIPGCHYDIWDGEIREVTDIESRQILWIQALMGDPGDNVPGCYGIGLQKAKNRVLKWTEQGLTGKQIQEEIVKEYEKSKKNEKCPYKHLDAADVALETYWLVRLKQEEDEQNPWQAETTTKLTHRKPRPLQRDIEERADGEKNTKYPEKSGCAASAGAAEEGASAQSVGD